MITGRFIKDDKELQEVLAYHRTRGEVIVTINGCFDLLHKGHIRILSAAKAQGDILIVGLNSDVSVKLNKGESRPIYPQTERAEMLCALEMVDYVVIFDEKDCMDFIRRVCPDVHVNDSAYGDFCIERETVLRGCKGRLFIFPKVTAPSTSSIISHLKG